MGIGPATTRALAEARSAEVVADINTDGLPWPGQAAALTQEDRARWWFP